MLSLIMFKQLPQLVLANPGPVVIEKLRLSNFTELIGQDNIFLTVGDAVRTCARKSIEEDT